MWTLNTHPKHSVHVTQTDEHYDCHTNESLLKGMLRLGRKGIPVGCVNGGCGVCKVRIVSGSVSTLACRVAPAEAVCLEVSARLVKPFSKNCNTFSPTACAQAAPAGSANQPPTTN